jgi:hypothetical protein
VIFFFYAEYYVSGCTDLHKVDGTIPLPANTDLNNITQELRHYIQQRNPKVIRSSIVVKCISRLG